MLTTSEKSGAEYSVLYNPKKSVLLIEGHCSRDVIIHFISCWHTSNFHAMITSDTSVQGIQYWDVQIPFNLRKEMLWSAYSVVYAFFF